MSETQDDGVVATIKKHRRWSPVWFLPMLTFIVGMWLLWQTWLNQGLSVDIEFPTGEGMVAGETQVRYKGIPVGVVKKLSPNEDNDSVIAMVQFQPEFRRLGLPEDTQFWLVQAQVSLTGVSGLGTLLTGNYLAIVPGKSDNTSSAFKALDKAPPLSETTPGLHLKLTATHLDSVNAGTLIYFRDIAIGSVQAYTLSDDRTRVIMDVHVKPEYSNLIHKNTRFWNASGIDVQASLAGIKVRTGSMLSLLFGGIAISENDSHDAVTAQNGDEFTLYKDFDAAQAGMQVRLTFNNADNLQAGVTRVIYKGVDMGRLQTITLDEQQRRVVGVFGLDPRIAKFITNKTRFWLVKPELSLSNGTNLDSLLRGGFVTFAPNDSGTPTSEFIAHDGPDLMDFDAPGLHVLLSAQELKGLSNGSPIFYRDVRVGSVLSQRFDRKKDRIDVHIVIDEEYAGLINNKTRFWNLSGVQINASLSGVEVKTGPLASLISGGITFDSPNDSKSQPVQNGARFELFRGEREAMRGFAAQVKFDSAAGLQAGVTKVIYRGIEVGRVDAVDVSSDFKSVTADIGFVRDAENLLREGTQFWLVKPELSLSNISGLDALFSGAYISLKPGKGNSKTDFIALKSAPPDGSGDPGLDLILLAQEGGGLSVGSPVLHKQIVVGSVQEVALSSDKKAVQVRVHIAPDFAGLVQSNTRFWQAGGVQANVGLNGLDVRSASLASIVQGGIAFANPEGPVNRRAIVNGDQFTLYSDENAAQMDGVEIQFKTDRIDGIRVGTELRYRGVVVGQVIALSYRDQFNTAQLLARLNRDASAFAVSGSLFFRVDGSLGLARNENVMAAISGPYIGVIPGGGDAQTEFDLLPREPALTPSQTGLTLALHSDRIGGLSKGDPVLYRQVKVGEVLFGELNAKGNGVTIHILIWPEHRQLVRRGSVFWRASGLSFDAGIFDGVQVRSESLETLIAGGISFATPDEDANDDEMQAIDNHAGFTLHEEVDDDWLDWAPVLK